MPPNIYELTIYRQTIQMAVIRKKGEAISLMTIRVQRGCVFETAWGISSFSLRESGIRDDRVVWLRILDSQRPPF